MANHQVTQTSINPLTSCPISLLIVDDDLHFLRGLRTLLNFYGRNSRRKIKIVGEVSRENNIFDAIESLKPDLILLDMELTPGNLSGLTILNQLKEISCPSKVLVLSAYRDDEVIFQAMQAAAWGYVLKDCLVEELLPAIATVLNDQVYLPPEVATRFFRSFKLNCGRSFNSVGKVELNSDDGNTKLTEREYEVLELLIEGASNRKISEELYITVATVKAHLTSIFEKFDVSSRTQAIVKAFKLGLV